MKHYDITCTTFSGHGDKCKKHEFTLAGIGERRVMEAETWLQSIMSKLVNTGLVNDFHWEASEREF